LTKCQAVSSTGSEATCQDTNRAAALPATDGETPRFAIVHRRAAGPRDDEGHGFHRPANAQRFYAAAEAFLGEHLGGRAEPAHPGEEIEPFLR
jgi:hypothetical protein